MSSVSTLEAERLLPDKYDRERLALGFDYDENTISSLKNADWDVLHQDWRPNYEFKTGREGAWVVDCTDEALDYLEGRIRPPIPPLRDVSYATNGDIDPLPSGPISRECPECEDDGILSEFGARRVHSSDAVWLQPLVDSNKATHVCSSCQTLFYQLYSEDGVSDSANADPTELINTTPDQRARYLERVMKISANPKRRRWPTAKRATPTQGLQVR